MPLADSSANEGWAPGRAVSDAVAGLYGASGAERFGISRERFGELAGEVVRRYCAGCEEVEQLQLVARMHIEDLVLARACSAGNETAWEVFLTRFRAMLYEAAGRIARDDTAGKELADGLYAELFGIPNREGRRISKLDYYMGRGSLEGWLRTVLAQEHVNRIRQRARDVSLDEQIEAGVGFAAAEETAHAVDPRVSEAVAHTLAEVDAEERFLLASYYLDRRTLAEIGRQLGVHESTVSRKLDKLTGVLHKRIRKRLEKAGIHPRRCDELLGEIDVRDLSVDVKANLRQERSLETF